jgi:hypothetical protein
LLAIENRNFKKQEELDKKQEELEELLAIENRNFKILAIFIIINIILFSIRVVDIIIRGVA